MYYDAATGLFHKEPPTDEQRSLTSADFYGDDFFAASSSISTSSAMRLAAVFACVKAIAETVSTLPLSLYKSADGAGGEHRQKAKDHYLSGFLNDAPNDAMTWVDARQAISAEQVLGGNSYAKIGWARGFVESFTPRSGQDVQPLLTDGGRLIYKLQGQTLTRSEIAHFKGLTCDGLLGISPITNCRFTMRGAQALNDHGLSNMENGVRFQGVLQMEKSFKSREESEAVRASWESAYNGANGRKVAILTNGMEFKPISMTPQDAQFIEQMNFSVEEIARIFGVPPHVIGHLARSTNNNIEHQGKEFYQRCIRPWLVRIEQTLNRTLLTDDERKQGYYFEHNPDGILSADYKTRIEGQKVAIQGGFKTINEVRKMNNDPPIEGGDVAMVPLNHVPLTQFGAEQAQSPTATPAKPSNTKETDGNEDDPTE